MKKYADHLVILMMMMMTMMMTLMMLLMMMTLMMLMAFCFCTLRTEKTVMTSNFHLDVSPMTPYTLRLRECKTP